MPDFTTATEVLEAILAGGESLRRLEQHLTTHDVKDRRFAMEAWKGVCAGDDAEAEERAYAARMAVVEEYADRAVEETLPRWATVELIELLVGSSQRTSYAAYGDEYIAGVLKLELPPPVTVCVPRALPAYSQAATVFGEGVNEVVRPLLQTSLKKKLLDTDWNKPDLPAFVAAVVTLREMIRAPELYIDSDAAAADPAVPCLFIRRPLDGGHQPVIGVLHHATFDIVTRPLDAVALWLLRADGTVPGVDGLLEALEGTDLRSSTAKSIVSGRKLLDAAHTAKDVVK